MPGLDTKFASLLPKLQEVSRRAEQPLAILAERRSWLLTKRIKTFQSALEKLQTGRFRTLEDLDDLVGFCIIIDTRSQQNDVLAFIRQSFNVKAVRGKSTLSDERVFDFDAPRVYSTLKMSEPNPSVSTLVFEIQIRTILQHAWSKITHPLVYKSATVDPRRLRLAAEILANIESLDRSLSTFVTTSKSVKYVQRTQSAQLDAIITTIDELVRDGEIPSIARPSNGRRLAESILNAMDLQKVGFDVALRTVYDFFRSQSPNFPLSVSLFELSLVALHNKSQLNVGRRTRPRYSYISAELITLFPEAKNISPTVLL